MGLPCLLIPLLVFNMKTCTVSRVEPFKPSTLSTVSSFWSKITVYTHKCNARLPWEAGWWSRIYIFAHWFFLDTVLTSRWRTTSTDEKPKSLHIQPTQLSQSWMVHRPLTMGWVTWMSLFCWTSVSESISFWSIDRNLATRWFCCCFARGTNSGGEFGKKLKQISISNLCHC